MCSFSSKATTLNKVYGPAWLVYGHSFAVENEHDQAMAAYCRASQLMKGYYYALKSLYIYSLFCLLVLWGFLLFIIM